MRIGLYPGTFDPITRGHLDIIKRACVLVDKLVIGVAINRDKNPLFSLEERVEMIERNLSKFEHNETNIIVEPFENLLIDKATEVGAQIIIRGLRAVSDFEYEYQLVGMNRAMNDNIETTFIWHVYGDGSLFVKLYLFPRIDDRQRSFELSRQLV